jgi:hypothetical protein
MRQTLWTYLGIFKKLYPAHPAPDMWEIYERGLSDVNDVDLSAACEICIRELKFFPMPAEILERVKKPDNFISTAPRYPDEPSLPGLDRKTMTAQIIEIGRNLGKIPNRFDGQHWTPENGWMPTSGAAKDYKPDLNKVDERPSAHWTEPEKESFLAARSPRPRG